jgi:hypothetical protein
MLGFSAISDRPLSALPSSGRVTPAAGAALPATGLVEADGQRGGYLVPQQQARLQLFDEALWRYHSYWQEQEEKDDEEVLIGLLG